MCKLKKSLYNLKQTSRQWNHKLTQTIIKFGYEQSKNDYYMFTERKCDKIVVFLVYVDNIMIAGNDQALVNELKVVLSNNFKIKDLGEIKYFFRSRNC